MKPMKKTLSVKTERRIQLKDVTRQIQEALNETGIQDGICVVYNPHTTAGLAINEDADPDVARDLESAFEALVPSVPFRHSEGNSPAHFLCCTTNHSLQILVEGGQLQLGRWQGVYFCEFDGPRHRQLWVKTIGA
jgi:secondary thiamine-phosphate synthase enzyme